MDGLDDVMAYLRRAARAAGKEHLLDAEADIGESVDDLLADDMRRLAIARHSSFTNSLPPLYTGMTFGAWRDRASLSDAVSQVREWAELYPLVDAGLFLYGKERGTGKTHLAIAAGHVLATKGYRVKLIDVVAMLNRIRNGFESQQPRIDVEGIARWSDILILDDLGAEKQSPWVSEQLYLLINTAIARQAALIITSNLDYGELASRMDDRVVSRLIGATDRVVVDDTDYRLEQHKRRRAR